MAMMKRFKFVAGGQRKRRDRGGACEGRVRVAGEDGLDELGRSFM
jgi:hypothetical protein